MDDLATREMAIASEYRIHDAARCNEDADLIAIRSASRARSTANLERRRALPRPPSLVPDVPGFEWSMGYEILASILLVVRLPLVVLGFVLFWAMTNREQTHLIERGATQLRLGGKSTRAGSYCAYIRMFVTAA